jgi:glyoxylase-like metal-dependent hydrolase (beta-lactamase superfamily II)
MNATAHGWNVADRESAVVWREYSFGGGVATTLVFRGAGDGLIVISPCNGIDAAALDELSEFGKVVALVASNGFHWLGQALWRKHFPEAKSFAPAQAIDRLAKKVPELPRFEPLQAAASLVGDRASIIDAPGHKAGSAAATVRGKNGTYWYAGDLFANIPKMPSNLVFRLLMSMTDSAPGYRLFRPAVWLQVKDKRVVRDWIDDVLTKSAPTTVVPAHGAPVSADDLIAKTKALAAQI